MGQIFVPQKIRAGYKSRNDTYTGKLAYVIYYDEKGTLRKETSFRSWLDSRYAGEYLGEDDFDNVPTFGFVLNKKVGGHKSDWNFRQTKARAYDPRGFEFEIGVENLLWILENTNSIKGKGLEGAFVYGWDGADLVLVPCDSPDYIRLMEYSQKRENPDKITAKNIVLGGVYATKKDVPMIYMGYFDSWDYEYQKNDERVPKNKGKHHWFRYANSDSKWNKWYTTKSLSSFIKVVSATPVNNYAELMDELERWKYFSSLDETKTKYIAYTVDEFAEQKPSNYGDYYIYHQEKFEFVRLEAADLEPLNKSSKIVVKINPPDVYGYRKWQPLFYAEFTLLEIIHKFGIYKKQYYLANGKPLKD